MAPPAVWGREVAILVILFGLTCGKFINFESGYEYEYKLESSSSVKNVGEFILKAKVGYINVGETKDGQEILVRVRTFTFSQASQANTVGHDINFNKWFSFVINQHGEILSVFYPQDEDDEVVVIKKGMAAMFAARLHHEDETYMTKTDDGWRYHVQELGHEGKHNSSYEVKSHSEGKVFTKIRHEHPVKHAISKYTKTLYFNSELGTIHTVHVNEEFSTMKRPVPGYDAFEGQRPSKAVNEFTDTEYPDMSAFGKGKLAFVSRHKIASIPDRKGLHVKTDSIHVDTVHQKPVRTHQPQLVIEEIRGNLTIMRNQPDEKATQEMTRCFHNLMVSLELLDDEQYNKLVSHYLGLDPMSIRNEKDRNHILDAAAGSNTERAQKILCDKVLDAVKPDVDLVLRFLVHIISMDDVPTKKLLTKLFQMGFETKKSPINLRQGPVYHRILLTIGSVARKLNRDGRHEEAATATAKIETMLGHHDPYHFRVRRSTMTEDQIEEDDTWRVILLGALGNAKMDQSYHYIVSHINSSNSQWIKRAGIHALRGYHHDHAANLLLTAAKTDEHDTVRYEALLQYQAHPRAKFLTPYRSGNRSEFTNGSAIYFNPWDLNSKDLAVHSIGKRSFLDEGFQFVLQSPYLDWKKMLGSTKIGASFGLLIKNLLDLKISALSGHAIADIHDEAYARVHLGVVGVNLDFFLARICFKGSAEYNINLLQEFGIDNLKELVELYDKIKNDVVKEIKAGIDLFKKIIRGEISIGDLIKEFKDALEQLPKKVLSLGKKAMDTMIKLGEIDEKELPPFIRPIRNLVTKVVTLYNDVKKDVMGFYNKLLETVTVIIPRAGKQIYTSIKAIIQAFKHFNQDPKKAISEVGGNVLNIGLEVKNLIDAVNKTKEACFFLKKEKPYWFELKDEFDEIKNLTKAVKNSLTQDGKKWVQETFQEGKDPVAEFTNGKFSTAQLREQVVGELRKIIDELLEPFDAIKTLGGEFFDRFIGVFNLVKNIKEAFNILKEGYRTARSLIDRIFGPKTHRDFPKKYRTPGLGCDGSGFYPSELKKGKEYDVDGVDLLISKDQNVVAPFPGYIRLSPNNPNEVIIEATGGSLKDTIIFLTNVRPNSTINKDTDSDYTRTLVNAGQVIGKSTSSECGYNHIHFAMKKTDGGVIDPTRYVAPRIPELPKWVQECDDYKLVWKFDVVAEGVIIGINGKDNTTEEPERTGGTITQPINLDDQEDPAKVLDGGLFGDDTAFGKVEENSQKVEEKAAKTKDTGLKNFFKKPAAFLQKFSIRKLKVGAILDLLDILGLDKSKESMAEVILKIKEIIDNKPCFNPYQMTDDQLRMELTERGKSAEGSRQAMITTLTSHGKKCFGLTLNMPKNVYCTFDEHCLGLECCVHLKVFMFLKTYKLYARFDPCKLEFIVGVKDKFEKSFGGLSDIYGGFDLKVKTNVKIDILGGMELIIRIKVEKTENVALGTVGVGFCSEDDEENCMPFLMLLDEAILPLPICNPDGSFTWPEVDWAEYYSRDAIKKRLKESAKKLAEESVEYGLKEALKQLGLPEELLEETPPCPRPEILTTEMLTGRLEDRSLATTGNQQQLIDRLLKAEKTCKILGKTVTLPAIKNDKLNRIIYLQISENCLHLQACVDVQIRTKLFNFTKAFNAYIQLDSCNFMLHIGFEKYKHSIILIGYDWGKPDTIPIGDAIALRFTIDKNSDEKVFIIDFGLKITTTNDDLSIDSQLIEQMKIPIPICNENFTLPGGGSIADFAKAMGGKLSQAAVDVIFQKLGLNKIFSEGPCQVKTSPTDCPWNIDVENYLPEKLKDKVTCAMPDNCFGLHCCVDFKFKIPFVDDPVIKSVPVFLEFDPCNFVLKVGFGQFKHTERLLNYDWGKPSTLTVGNGDPAPVTISFTISQYPKGFIVDLSVLACIPIDGKPFCFPEEGIELMKGERIPACDARSLANLTNIDFSLEGWMKEIGAEAGQKLASSAARLLLDQLGITPYLLDERCDIKREPYTSNIDGWRNDCPKPIKKLPSLPKGLVCHLSDTCTKIDCCFDVDFLDLSFHAFLNINTCDYFLEAAIEKVKVKYSLLGDDINLDEGITGDVKISDFFRAEYGVRKMNKKFLLDLTIKVCFDKDKCQMELPVLVGTEIPQFICDLDAQLNFNVQNFSLSEWAKDKGLDAAKSLTKQAVRVLLEQLGIDDKLLNPPCSRTSLKYLPATDGNWKNDCPKVKNLPAINVPASCYIPDYCTGVDCCIHSDLLDLSINTYLKIDTCNYVIQGAIEKFGFSITILEYDWGEEKTEKLSEFLSIRFKIDRLLEEKMFIVDLAVKMCLQGKDDCELELPVFQQNKLPMPLCNMEMGFKIKDFSLKTWLQERGGDITAILANQLMDHLGITEYLKDEPCTFLQEPFKTAAASNNGWNKDCPLNMTLPQLPDSLTCYIPDYCTGLICCTEVPQIRRSFQAHLLIDSCNFILSVGIEKINFNVSLVEYEWGTDSVVDIGGIFKLTFSIEDLEGAKQFIVNMRLQACFTAGEACQLVIPVFTDMRVPKILCDWDATLALKDFKLDDWLKEQAASIGDGLSDIVRDKLLEKLGISPYLLEPMCNQTSSNYAPSVQGWKKDCPLNINLPALPENIICTVPDFCTGINCCLNVPLLRRSFQVLATINMCTYILTIGIEDVKFRKSLTNYKFGEPDHFNVRGVVRIDYTIDDLQGEKQFLLSANMSVCLSSDQPCQSSFVLMKNTRIPKLFCDWNATTGLKDFSLSKFLEEQKQALGEKLSQLTLSKLFEALGISRYLLKPQCDRSSSVYSPANTNGWKYDCPLQTLDFGKLPNGVTCRIPDFCTGIDCCVHVPIIGHSFNTKVYLNACDYTLTVSIENLVYKTTLLNYKWGTKEQFNMNGVVKIEFVIDNLEGAKQYMISLSASLCFDSTSPCLEVPVLENARVPKILCDWESDYSIKDFSISTWLTEKGEQIGGQLSDILLSKLYEELGIAAYLNNPSCNRQTGMYNAAINGWKNNCPALTNLPTLPSDVTCSVPDHCGGLSCCVDVQLLKRSFEAFIYLNPCDFTFRVGIEKYQFNRNLINYKWGTLEEFTLKKVVRIGFTIDDLSSEKRFLVNMNISVCLESNKPCLISIPVLTNAKIPKLVCDWDSTVALKDFSLQKFLEDQKQVGIQKLTSTLRAKLFEKLEIAGYLRNPQCDRTKDQFAGADNKGWTNECPSTKVAPLLPDLPDFLTCNLGSRCTSIDCCADVGFLDRSFYFSIDVNMCDYTITATIENFSYTRKLFDYKWGEVDHFYLKGVVRVEFTLNKLAGEKAIETSVNLTVCLEENSCLFDKQVLDKKKFPQPLCDFKETLKAQSFSVSEWKKQEKVPSSSSLTELLVAKLLEKVDLSDYLTEPACKRDAAPYIPANSKNWKKDCPSSITLPTLPDSTRCHWSTDCSTIDCCIYVGLIKRSVNLKINIDICNLEMTLTAEKFSYTISLFDYEWGASGVFHLKGRVRMEYKLENKPDENKIIADLTMKVCFEDSTCLLELPVLQQASISYSPCDITKPAPFKGVSFDFWSLKSCMLKPAPTGCTGISLPAAISDICHLSDNCQGVSCCLTLDLQYLGVYSISASFNLDHCANKLTYSLENKQWEKTLLSLPLDKNITEPIGEAIELSYVITDTGSSYVVSVNIKLCALNTYQNKEYCKYWKPLDQKSFIKPGCAKRRKRRSKRSIERISREEYEVNIRTLLQRNASNEEIKAFMDEVKNDEATEIEKNLFPDWEDGGQVNNIRSALKTMGSTNPSTILYTSDNGKFNVGIEGSEEIFKILGVASNLVDNAEQAFIVGKGLTGAGAKLLGAKLANMTIGEIMATVDAKNIDPEKALELVKELRNLALALYSEILDAVLSGAASDAFKSVDLVLQGDFSFPRQEATIFKYTIYFLLGGLVPMNFRFGAGCTYGVKFVVGGKIMKMVAFGEAVPYGAVLTYGELNVGFILYAGLRLEGYIMTTSFPTRAEIGFSKFPLDIKLKMDLELVPLRLRLLGVVTLRIDLGWLGTIKKTLFKATLWEYSTPTIRKRMIDFGKDEKDKSPPAFSEYTDKTSGRKKRAAGIAINQPTRHCFVRQLPDRDYTEPAIEISARSEDDKSQVKLFLTGGTRPGLADALPSTQLGGPSSVITTKLSQSGRPVYFTLVGRNSGGGESTVTCSIPTYDTSLPGGRFLPDFTTSSNPQELRASVVAFEDSDLIYTAVGAGLGKGIYGDEVEHWKTVNLKERDSQNYNPSSDPHGFEAKKHFAAPKGGRLIGPVASEFNKINFAEDCMKKCLLLPQSKCLSINYDYGASGHCQLLESIEGHDHKLAVSGDYVHAERIGVGLAHEFVFDKKNLRHDHMYYFNMDLKNSLGYRNIISTKGVLIDTTPPVPGEGKMNATRDDLEKMPCVNGIPTDRPEYKEKCIGQSDLVLNHRIIVDGEGSSTVFNGHTPLVDQKYFRANRYISANWDGIHDKETGLLTYSFTAGSDVCLEEVHPHHDPHAHLYDESEWTHTGIIKREETNPIPDGKYYVTVRALNKVQYGGPLTTTICHSNAYVIDNSKPFVHEVFNVQYDEEKLELSVEYNATDPESDIKEIDICLGQTTKDCLISDWERYPHSGEVLHGTDLPGGVAVWAKIRAWNNVNISAIKSADHPIILDNTPPIAGHVFDGPLFRHDLTYSKNSDKICANWVDFYDPESGIFSYSMFVRSAENDAYLTNGTDYDHRTHEACIDFDSDVLQHGKKYYIELWAFNAGHRQLNVSNSSDGVIIDLTVPVQGEVIDGNRENFVDVDFSAATATVAAKWKGHSDPESNIRSYEVQILRASNKSTNFEVLRDWHQLDNSTEKIEWHNFHLKHRDSLKTKLRTTNGALGQIVEETDGYIVDLTPPTLIYLNDGKQQNQDIDYQSTATSVSANFKFVDDESGIDHYRYQIFKFEQGTKHQIYPANGKWEELTDITTQSLEVDSFPLSNGARYYVRVGAVNRAKAQATYDTNGFLLDQTPPEMRWVHVGVFNGEDEEDIGGSVYQSDTKGIKATWFAIDDVSGIKEYLISVGTTPGGQEVLAWRSFGSHRDGYINDITLQVKKNNSPYYYVTVKAINGAGLESGVKTSTRIHVVEEDKAGLVIDGADGTDREQMMGVDVDYQRETGTVTVQFDGFESALHGISKFDWAVGTTAGGEDVQPFITSGLIHEERENVPGEGIASSGYGQAVLSLESGKTYYTTVRGISNAGNVLESISDGFTVDITPPVVDVMSLSGVSDKMNLTAGKKIYQSQVDSLSAEWKMVDKESGIDKLFYSVGSYPGGADIHPATQLNTFLNGEGSLPVGQVKPATDGKPNIVTFWAENMVGLVGKTTSATLIVDTTPPIEGVVTCPTFIQPHSSMKCTWDGFVDSESPIVEFKFALGSQEGLTDVLDSVNLPGYSTSYLVADLKDDVSHGKKYFALVTATNTVGKTISAVSNAISVDVTPPTEGSVVELKTEYIINVTSDRATSLLNSYTCNAPSECASLDAMCQESLTSLNIAWSPFKDVETDIVKYEVAVGTTRGGGQVKPFFTVPVSKRYLTIKNLNLNRLKQVYVTVKATNGAGLSTISTSNGIYLSYISQGLEPLSPIGVWDGDSVNGDIDFQTNLDTIKSRWDVSGDPCPAVKYEWAIERIDGLRVQNFTSTKGLNTGGNDQLRLRNGERYYILLRVTNAGGFTYIIRSNGVTIEEEPLIPGQVNDGDVQGYDLNFVYTKRKASANWNSFGVAPSDGSNGIAVESGNAGVVPQQTTKNQDIEYYEVAIGKDRRFPKTRDNVVPFTNVGLNTTVTFFDLDLVPLSATYYFTVRAYSKSFSMAEVTSNGFQVGYDDGVQAGVIDMNDYLKNDTVVDIQWDGFTSKVGMFMYYVALSTNNNASSMPCRQFIDGGSMNPEDKLKLFDVTDIKNVGKNTFIQLVNLTLQQNNVYYVTVIGVDKAGECNATSHEFIVDITPPDQGQIKVGPYYNMKMSYTSKSEMLEVDWKDFTDEESGIKCYRVSLIEEASCDQGANRVTIVPDIEMDENSTSYRFMELSLKPSRPYIVKITVENMAGLIVSRETTPVLYDVSVPTAGYVADGTDYRRDIVWSKSSSVVKGMILQLPTPDGPSCPARNIPFSDNQWQRFDSKNNYDTSGRKMDLTFRSANVFTDNGRQDELEIKLAKDAKSELMFSGAYHREADMVDGGKYEFNMQAADGKGKAVTSVVFWDGPMKDLTDYDYTQEPDWTVGVCGCCRIDKNDPDCLKICNCEEFLAAKKVVKRAADNSTTGDNSWGVKDLTPEEREALMKEKSDADLEADKKSVERESHRSCGIQVLAGDAQKVITWCKFKDNLNRPMKVERKLTFDPSKSFNNYKIEFRVLHDVETEGTWCLNVFVNNELISELCGIPMFTPATKLVMLVRNWKNYIPPPPSDPMDAFKIWTTKARFTDLIMPPEKTALCRSGNPFRGGTNAIVEYEAGLGRTANDVSVVPYRKVATPCVPCRVPCDRYTCQSSCESDKSSLLAITLDGLNLPATETINGTVKPILYYLSVMAMLGSGRSVVSSSNGFYIDNTKPVFDMEAMLYIDVAQGNFTPVTYQASNDTIKAIWLCQDNESMIVEYMWGIGTEPGKLDLQDYVSTGMNPTGINDKLQGILDDNSTYYVTVKCRNGAGLETIHPDKKGVTVLMYPPDITDVGTNITGAERFDESVTPENAMKSTDATTIGCSWTVSQDPSIREYDFCVGSSEDPCSDIFPCTWVGYNVSGEVLITNGWLEVDGRKIGPIGTYSSQFNRTSSENDSAPVDAPSGFKMEPGRTLFLCMRMCNEARRCTKRLVGTSVIVDNNSKMATSTNGESISVSLGSSRKKREVEDVTVETPQGLQSGQSIILTRLNQTDLEADYRSDASTDFIPYITNPNTTLDNPDNLHRLLVKRLNPKPTDKHFAVTSVGNTPLPGPLTVKIKYNPNTVDTDRIPTLTHWNPVQRKWELSMKTCKYESNPVNNVSGEVIIKVCNTWSKAEETTTTARRKREAGSDVYFKENTQFMVTDILKTIPNSPPRLTSRTSFDMLEDEGTLISDLKTTDDEGDEVVYSLDQFTSSLGTVNLTSFGRLLYLPCPDCSGELQIPVVITEVQNGDIPPETTRATLTVNVKPQNDAPVVFAFRDSVNILRQDPTEPVTILLEQNREGMDKNHSYTWTFGVYDVDKNERLEFFLERPVNGSLTIGPEVRSTPSCGQTAQGAMLPCSAMNLPHPPQEMTWLYHTMTYQPKYDISGYDEIRLYIRDSQRVKSDVVSVRMAMMQMPCQNGGICQTENVNATYTCQDSRRAESFYDYYSCKCRDGWTGQTCEDDFDECESSPCTWPYVCYNMENSYTCACSLDEPNCDAMEAWMIALIVIAIIMVVIISVLIFYICIIRGGRVNWSNMCNRFGSKSSTNGSSERMSFNNKAYEFDSNQELEEDHWNHGSSMAIFNHNHQLPYDGISGPVHETGLSDLRSRASSTNSDERLIGRKSPRFSNSPHDTPLMTGSQGGMKIPRPQRTRRPKDSEPMPDYE